MAQVFQINGTNLSYPIKADWQPAPVNQSLNGLTPHDRWTPHTLVAEWMPATEFDTLYGYQGAIVSLTTTNFDNRNSDYKVYFGVEFKSISGEHVGPIFQNVTMEFLIRLS